MMKRILLTLAFCLLPSFSALAVQCVVLPVIGNGRAQTFDKFGDPIKTTGDWRPDIPDEILGSRQKKMAAQPYSASHPIVTTAARAPAHPDVVTCFNDGLKLPASVHKIETGEAKRIIQEREPRSDPSQLDKVVTPPSRTPVRQAIVDTLRSWAWLPRLFQTAVAWAAVATDNFDRADDADLGADWDQNTGFGDVCSIVSNEARATTAGVPCGETYNALVPGGSQYGKLTIGSYSGGVGDYVAVALRADAAADQMYVCTAETSGGSTTTRIRRRNAGGTTLASENATNWASTDTLEFRASATALDCLRNGSTLLSTTDATYATGRVGLLISNASGAVGIADFELGDFGAAGTAQGGVTLIQ